MTPGSDVPSNRPVLGSIEGEFRRYRRMAEAALAQLEDAEVSADPSHGNSLATIVWHMGGNLASRFTDFLTTDGEKPWRNRESEFESRVSTPRAEVMAKWEAGWTTLFDALSELDDGHLSETVTIRGLELTAIEALHRSLAHAAFHVGQIVQRARRVRGDDWQFLSIPPGESEAYNRDPGMEKPPTG